MFVFMHTLWDIPLMVIVCVVLLWQTVGMAAVAGLAVLMVILPFNAIYVGGKIRKLQVSLVPFVTPPLVCLIGLLLVCTAYVQFVMTMTYMYLTIRALINNVHIIRYFIGRTSSGAYIKGELLQLFHN